MIAPTERVLNAIDELRETFPESEVTYSPDGEGGAWVTIDQVSLGPAFVQETSWHFRSRTPIQGPMFTRTSFVRTCSGWMANPHGDGFAVTSYVTQNVHAMEISRRSNNFDPSVDTAASKVLKVLKRLGER